MIKQVVLASGSPRRKRLLELINLEFNITVSTVPETTRASLDPIPFAEEISLSKARQVASQKENALVIGADTLVVHQDEKLGKPTNMKDARQMLHRLSDDTHQVITGVSLVKSGKQQEFIESLSFHETTEVVFGPLTDHEIDEYVKTGGPMDKAGSYGIQDDWGSLFVKKIVGDYYNVVGFPLFQFYHNLKFFAPNQLPHAI